MFTTEKGLEKTGEVFLVNKDRYMLTDSRFYSDSSILRTHLSEENIMAKFQEHSGHKRVVDYRGFKVLTAFEVCRIGTSQWLLIAKIDEDEMVTDTFRENRPFLKIKPATVFKPVARNICPNDIPTKKPVQVNMDEFRKVTPNDTIATYGLSTCTAVIIAIPDRLAYMSHISNLDRIYGGNTTDLIRQTLRHIKTFEIYPYERRQLTVTIVATHLTTIGNALYTLVDEGIFLSQVRFIYTPEAQYANLTYDCGHNRTLVEYVLDRETGKTVVTCPSSIPSVDNLIRPYLE